MHCARSGVARTTKLSSERVFLNGAPRGSNVAALHCLRGTLYNDDDVNSGKLRSEETCNTLG